MNDDATVAICRGPPQCEGGKESCPWCIEIDPDDPDWEAAFERKMRGQ